jgi:hypothetical protein
MLEDVANTGSALRKLQHPGPCVTGAFFHRYTKTREIARSQHYQSPFKDSNITIDCAHAFDGVNSTPSPAEVPCQNYSSAWVIDQQ